MVVAEIDGESSLYMFGDASKGATALTKTLKGSFNTPTKVSLIDKRRKLDDSDKLGQILSITAGTHTSFITLESC